MSGVGTATNGADGTLYTDQAYAAALFIRNETSGRTYEVRTDTPGDLFLLGNAEPGRYSLLELWAQVKTDNDYITIRSDFYKSPAFDVAPGHVANLGVNTWNFSYDLTRGAEHERLSPSTATSARSRMLFQDWMWAPGGPGTPATRRAFREI